MAGRSTSSATEYTKRNRLIIPTYITLKITICVHFFVFFFLNTLKKQYGVQTEDEIPYLRINTIKSIY